MVTRSILLPKNHAGRQVLPIRPCDKSSVDRRLTSCQVCYSITVSTPAFTASTWITRRIVALWSGAGHYTERQRVVSDPLPKGTNAGVAPQATPRLRLLHDTD